MESMTYYVSIGNSDDKLTQKEWSEFCQELRGFFNYEQNSGAIQIHGIWYSASSSQYQNMCIAFVFLANNHVQVGDYEIFLAGLAKMYQQDYIAFAKANTKFIKGVAE